MRSYLANIHKQPHHHKNRFALLVSGAFTLVILAIWIMVNFGIEDKNLAETKKESTPLGSLIGGVGAVMGTFWSDFGEVKQGLETVTSQTQEENGR